MRTHGPLQLTLHYSKRFTSRDYSMMSYNDRCLAQLNMFVREQINQINLPMNLPDKTEDITDLYLNLKNFSFSLWSSREREPKTAAYIPIPEVSNI